MNEDQPLAETGLEITIGNPWWRKGVPTRCVIREVWDTSAFITVQPLEGNPHQRSLRCEDAGVRWHGEVNPAKP